MVFLRFFNDIQGYIELLAFCVPFIRSFQNDVFGCYGPMASLTAANKISMSPVKRTPPEHG
jgi:hypothetical protein